MPAHKIVSERQEEILLQIMQENLHIATSRVASRGSSLAKQSVITFWETVASKLNSIGSGTTKTGPKWRDYWAERKYAVRKKVSMLEAHAHALGTGDGPVKTTKLTDADEIILDILGKVPSSENKCVAAASYQQLSRASTQSDRPSHSQRSRRKRPPASNHQQMDNQLYIGARTWAIDMEQQRRVLDERRSIAEEKTASALLKMAETSERMALAMERSASAMADMSDHTQQILSIAKELLNQSN